MARAQIFMFDVIIAATAFFVMVLVIASLSSQAISPGRQKTYEICVSALDSLKANATLSDVANGTAQESLLNYSLSQLPARFGYHLNLTTYSLSGEPVEVYSGTRGNLTDAELHKDITAVSSPIVTDNSTPLFGTARLRCWVGP